MGQLKRRRPAHLLRPGQMLTTLGSLELHALLQHGGIWLAVRPEMAELLNQCCTGQMDGGPGTADEVAAVLTPLVGEPRMPPGLAGASGACEQLAGLPPQLQEQQGHGQQGQGTEQEQGQQGQGQAQVLQQDPQLPLQGQEGGWEGAGGDASMADGRDSEAAAPGARTPEVGSVGNEAGPESAAGIAGAAAVESEVAGTAGSATEAAAAAGTAEGFRCNGGEGGGRGGGGGRGPESGGRGRGRGRRGQFQPPPPFAPAAEGCRLVAVRLTLEEAFFLQYVLRCLQVYELRHGSPLPPTSDDVRLHDSEGLWKACRAIRSNFVTSYVAYHHLKAKGWIPRSGLLYGVDYVVYQLHPVGAHSDFGVLVVPLAEGGRPAGPHTPPLGWLDLQITNRLVNQVVKKLILLYLYEQPGGPDHTSPACMASFLVEERIIRRWVPDATRD